MPTATSAGRAVLRPDLHERARPADAHRRCYPALHGPDPVPGLQLHQPERDGLAGPARPSSEASACFGHTDWLDLATATLVSPFPPRPARASLDQLGPREPRATIGHCRRQDYHGLPGPAQAPGREGGCTRIRARVGSGRP